MAEALGVNERTVRRYIEEGKLEAIQLPKGFRVSEEDFARFTQRRRVRR